MSHNDDRITVYSDYVCPFCYLGRRSLEEYQETRERELDIDWHPFDLRSQKRGPDGEIDHSVEDGKDETYFEQVRQNVARLKDEYDADEMLDLDELPENVDSLDAQVASLYVQLEYPDQWLAFDGRFGAYVTVFQRGDCLLSDEDSKISAVSEPVLKTKIHTDACYIACRDRYGRTAKTMSSTRLQQRPYCLPRRRVGR